jgi:hypothetical protein
MAYRHIEISHNFDRKVAAAARKLLRFRVELVQLTYRRQEAAGSGGSYE